MVPLGLHIHIDTVHNNPIYNIYPEQEQKLMEVKKMTSIKNIIAFLCVYALLLSIVGCDGATPVTPPDTSAKGTSTTGTYEEVTFDYDKEIKTIQFKSEGDLLAFIKENSGGSSFYGYSGIAGGLMRNDVGMAADAVMETTSIAKTVSAPQAAPTDFSETNVQVEGIDEADIIKTDGSYIYTVTNNVVYMIKAYPGEYAEIVSTISLKNAPSGLFIDGDRLAVFGNFWDNDHFKEIGIRPRYGMTYFNIYDISDRVNPELVKEYKFEGNYFNARMKGDHVYFITTSRPEIRPRPMPLIIDGSELKYVAASDIYYYNIEYRDPLFVTINSINIDDTSEDISSKAVAVEGSQNMYMSEDNIYITYTQYINEYDLQKQIMMEILEDKLTEYDKKLIEKIKNTDNDVMNRYEKDAKILQVYQTYVSYMTQEEMDEYQDIAEGMLKEKLEEYEFFEFTVINRIEVDEDHIDPKANGKVPGHVINQFSLDEYGDVLRVATTINRRWSRFEKERTESTNNIYTLSMGLDIMDKLEGLAEGESIYSTRFIGDRLYMVTFRQVDPFFVIDLSDPDNIKELGELKIPGFSRYLHPYDKDTIIGIGQDATETGRTKGLKISLFDVSDVENPKEVAKYVTESRYAGSTALYEHKAFLFSKEKELLVIPAYSYNYQGSTENYNGAFVFRINKDKIELRGLIDHSSGTDQRWYSPSVERRLYIEEQLYTKSPGLLRINEIGSLEKVKNIELKEIGGKIPIY
jgi:inhibitor of cysteine peptidase